MPLVSGVNICCFAISTQYFKYYGYLERVFKHGLALMFTLWQTDLRRGDIFSHMEENMDWKHKKNQKPQKDNRKSHYFKGGYDAKSNFPVYSKLLPQPYVNRKCFS